MAHKKGQGSTRNGRDSKPQYRGVKVFDSTAIRAGGIIVRQVGSSIHAGRNVGTGRDYTLFSLIDGLVKFERLGRDRRRVSVYPAVKSPTASAAVGPAEDPSAPEAPGP